jgi:hypothetical protein
MIETPIKTRLQIFVNGFKSQLSTMVSDIETIVGKPNSEGIILNLANDIASIPFYFDKEREDEYEWLMGFICFNCLVNSSSYDNSFFIDLINKWNSFDFDRKNSFYSIISRNKKNLTILTSIQELARLNNDGKLTNSDFQNLTTRIEFLLITFSENIVSIDKFISESESEKLNHFKQILIDSKTLQTSIDLNQHLKDKLAEIGFDNNQPNLPDSDEIRNLILKNQKKISSVDKKYILEFLKLQKYLKNQKDLIYQSVELLKLLEDVSYMNTLIDVIKNQIGSYNVVYLNSVTLIVCLCENELVVFYELYETFDNLGVFKTNYEKEVLDSLNSIGSNINNLNKNIVHKLMIIEQQLKNISHGINELNSTMQQNIQAINNLEDSIVSSFKSLETSIGINFNQLSQNISGHLSKIESGIAYNNLISTVSAYQLYKLNKQTKPLLPK